MDITLFFFPSLASLSSTLPRAMPSAETIGLLSLSGPTLLLSCKENSFSMGYASRACGNAGVELTDASRYSVVLHKY